jgi:hypothetical protein
MTESRIVFYYRDGCHLCEELVSLLHRGWPQLVDGLEWVDVDRDSALRERFGLRIPVLERDGVLLCELRPDPECLQEHFGPPVNPV